MRWFWSIEVTCQIFGVHGADLPLCRCGMSAVFFGVHEMSRAPPATCLKMWDQNEDFVLKYTLVRARHRSLSPSRWYCNVEMLKSDFSNISVVSPPSPPKSSVYLTENLSREVLDEHLQSRCMFVSTTADAHPDLLDTVASSASNITQEYKIT